MIAKRPLTLVQKAILLVAVPLVFELVVLGMVWWLLHESDIEVHKTDHSKAVIAKTDEVIEGSNDVGITYIAYDADTKPEWEERYRNAVDKLRENLKALGELSSDDADELAVVRTAKGKIEEALTILQGEMSEIKSGGRLNLAIAEDLQERLKDVENDLTDRIIAPEKAAQELERTQRSKWMLRVGLGLAAFTAVVGSIIFWFIQKHTARRLGALIDNGMRLGRGEELAAVLDAGDEISQIDAVFHEAADKLKEAARKERAVIDNAADVICSIDGEGNFVAVSPASEKLWGYSPSELVGKHWLDFINPEDVARCHSWSDNLKVASNLKKTASDGALEMRVVRKDGTLVDVRWSAHWSQAERSMFCVVHDISERLELERFKQQFVATISHDLRTPLSAVKSTLELLGAGTWGVLSEKGQMKVSRAEDNLRHTIDLINNLLDLEKIEAAKIELNIERIELGPLLRRCVAVVAPLAESRSIEMGVSEGNIVLQADEQRIGQVIINLLGNAIKFSPPESKVSIEFQTLESEQGMARISISDQGPGIPDEMKELIFDRYRQLSATADGVKPSVGTGLGLAICKAIVEAHNGRIGVDSKDGAGSCFWFEVPRQGGV